MAVSEAKPATPRCATVRGRPPARSGAAETGPLPRRWSETLAWGSGAEGSKPARGRSRELLNHPIPAGCGVSAALAGTLAGEGWKMLGLGGGELRNC